jgi:hypothetical protein
MNFIKKHWLELILIGLMIYFFGVAYFATCCTIASCSTQMNAMWIIMIAHVGSMLFKH